MNKRILILLALVFLVLISCQLGDILPTQKTGVPSENEYPPAVVPGSDPYVAPEQPTADPNLSGLYPAFKDGDQVSWDQAIDMILNGEVKKIITAQTMQITLFLKDGRTLLTQEPLQGELQKALQACGEVCKDIEVVNE